jgi:hypothetical protein
VASFLADENFPLPVVEESRRLGHDVVTIADVGKTGHSLPDEAILLLATADVRTLLTLNRSTLFGCAPRCHIMQASSFARSTSTSLVSPGESMPRSRR